MGVIILACFIIFWLIIDPQSLLTILLVLGFVFVFIIALVVFFYVKQVKENKKIIEALEKNCEFSFESINSFISFRKNNMHLSISGAYVFHNLNNGWHYVGQSIDLLSRVNNHISGRGNGDVYADIKYGNKFTIKLVPLGFNGLNNLNDLERELIRIYHADKEYNKTKGNS